MRKQLEAVAKGEWKGGAAPKNVTDWGIVVAAKLEPYLYISEEDQCEYVDFAGQFGVWKVTKKDKAQKAMTRNVLIRELRLMSMFIGATHAGRCQRASM